MDNYVKNVGTNKMRRVKNVDNLWITFGQPQKGWFVPGSKRYRDKVDVKCDIDSKIMLDIGIMYIIMI